MSGNGGTTYDPEPPRESCDRLTFKTVLSSPDPTVVGRLSTGDELELYLETTGGKKRVVTLLGRDIAGSITSDRLPQLISCMEKGFTFTAEVLSAKAGRVEVNVTPKK